MVSDFRMKCKKSKRGNSRSEFLFNNNLLNSKRSQVTIFIIIAILIIAGVGAYFVLRGGIFQPSVPAELEPVYSYYLSCMEQEALNGALILGEQGGYIVLPEFSPGSENMPF